MSASSSSQFSHLSHDGSATMVDVSSKAVQVRKARAEGWLNCHPETIRLLKQDALPKGDVLTVAKIAGIQAAKKTADLIPLCHTLPLGYVDVVFSVEESRIGVSCSVSTSAQTGVEMEALTGVTSCLLTLYDMCKAVDKQMSLTGVRVVEKLKQ